MTWGFRIETQDFLIYLRCSPVCGDYNFYAYCYDKNMLLDKLAGDRGLPRYCYAHLPTTGEDIRIDFATSGYNVGENQNEQGGNKNELDLQDRTERIAISEFEPLDRGGEADRQIRTDEARISQAASEGDLHDTSDRGEVEQPPARDRGNGEHDAFGDYRETGDEPWGDGTDEGREPDGMGADDEQHQELSGGNGSGSIPYGYNRLPNDKQTLVVDPVASEIVKRIFLLANEGKSARAIERCRTKSLSFLP